MAWTQTDIDALKAAIKTGVLEVRTSSGRTVRYQSVDDMLKILGQMEAEANPSDRFARAAFSRE